MYSVKHTPYRFALVVTDQNKFTGLVVVEVDQTGEITQLTKQGRVELVIEAVCSYINKSILSSSGCVLFIIFWIQLSTGAML